LIKDVNLIHVFYIEMLNGFTCLCKRHEWVSNLELIYANFLKNFSDVISQKLLSKHLRKEKYLLFFKAWSKKMFEMSNSHCYI